MTTFTKRRFIGATIALAMGLATPGFAADYPTGPITMLVGYGAGGQTDLVARATARVMSEESGCWPRR